MVGDFRQVGDFLRVLQWVIIITCITQFIRSHKTSVSQSSFIEVSVPSQQSEFSDIGGFLFVFIFLPNLLVVMITVYFFISTSVTVAVKFNIRQDVLKRLLLSCRKLLKVINKFIYTIAIFKMIFFSTSTIKICSNVYIFFLKFGNNISIYLRNTQNVVHIVDIQPSLKTNTKSTQKKHKKKQAKKRRWTKILPNECQMKAYWNVSIFVRKDDQFFN